MFIHNGGQNFFSTRLPHSFNILSRVPNSEIPFPWHLTNLFLLSNIFIYIQGQFFSSTLLHIHSTFCIYFLKLQPHVCASRLCLTTHKGSWVKLLVCPISILTSSSTHLAGENSEIQTAVISKLKTLRCWKLLQRFPFLSPSAWCT